MELIFSTQYLDILLFSIFSGEQRHQELLTCQSQLKSFSEMAKSMLINQGTELYQFAHKLSSLVAKANSDKEISTTVKDSELIKQEIEAAFKHLLQQQSDNQSQNEDSPDSLQTLSMAIEKRRRSESILAVKNTSNGAQAVLDNFDKLEQIIDRLVNEKSLNGDDNDQNDQNQANTDSSHQESVDDMRAKFSKHLQIYKTNYEQAESEIKRMDELYQDLIENVLKVRNMGWFFISRRLL